MSADLDTELVEVLHRDVERLTAQLAEMARERDAVEAERESLKLQLHFMESPPFTRRRLTVENDRLAADLARVTEERDAALAGRAAAWKAQEIAADGRDRARSDLARVTDRVTVLERERDTPELYDFQKAVVLEAQHQRARWGTDHDAGKTDADWFWLIGYLAGKALHNPDGDADKQLHRIITVAAAAANWHAAKLGKTNMRPGIDGDAALSPPPGDALPCSHLETNFEHTACLRCGTKLGPCFECECESIEARRCDCKCHKPGDVLPPAIAAALSNQEVEPPGEQQALDRVIDRYIYQSGLPSTASVSRAARPDLCRYPADSCSCCRCSRECIATGEHHRARGEENG